MCDALSSVPGMTKQKPYNKDNPINQNLIHTLQTSVPGSIQNNVTGKLDMQNTTQKNVLYNFKEENNYT